MLVRDLIKMLKKVDPSLPIEMTMGDEYQSPIGAIFISNNKLMIDDIPVDLDGRFERPASLIYNEFDEVTV